MEPVPSAGRFKTHVLILLSTQALNPVANSALKYLWHFAATKSLKSCIVPFIF